MSPEQRVQTTAGEVLAALEELLAANEIASKNDSSENVTRLCHAYDAAGAVAAKARGNIQ